MLEKFVSDYENEEKSEEFKLQLINSVVYSFLKKPKEMLPILHRLFTHVLNSEGESYVVVSKVKLYWTAMQNDIRDFEKTFTEFFESLNVQDNDSGSSLENYVNINTLSIIYHKPAESFTKPLKYFINQRLKEAEELEGNADNVEINIDEEEEPTEHETPSVVTEQQNVKQVVQPKKNDDIDFLDMDFDQEGTNHDNDDDINILDIDFSDTKPKAVSKQETAKQTKKAIEYVPEELDPSDFQDEWMNIEER